MRFSGGPGLRGRRDDPERIASRVHDCAERYRAIEGCETAAHADRQAQEIHVGQLTMTAYEGRLENLVISKRDGGRPERVVIACAEPPQSFYQFRRPSRGGTVGRTRDYSNESIFRDRTRRPAIGAVIGKPVVGELVMNVIGIEERDEQIDVEQRDAAHVSSRSSLTNRIVGRGAPADLRERSGTPLRTRVVFDGVRAFRASSDRTFPAVVPRADAISLAACRMSSSRSSVVRTETSSRITHQMSKMP